VDFANSINTPLDIETLKVVSQEIDNKGEITINVLSRKNYGSCHICGKSATKSNGTAPERVVRHLPIFGKAVYLRITPIRYSCDDCDHHPTTTEQYDWCERYASVTKKLETYLMRSLIHSTIEDVAKKESIGLKIIQSVLDRKIKKEVDWSKIKDIETLGIDEISLKKGHQSYVTIISSKSKNNELAVIGVFQGRSKEKVKSFLKSIPSNLKKTIKSVCTDMYDGFVNAVVEVLGPKILVIDRYHVARLYRKPLDKLRVKEMARLKSKLSKKEYEKLEGMMWILRRKHECLTDQDKTKLKLLYKHSPKLKAAHKYALQLTHIFNTYTSKKNAMAKISRWIVKIGKNDVRCFDSFIVTLKKYKSYIGNYFNKRKTSGFVEGLNNKIKTAKRRCYGFIKTETIFQRLYLDLQGFGLYI